MSAFKSPSCRFFRKGKSYSLDQKSNCNNIYPANAVDFLPSEQLRCLQNERLRETVYLAYYGRRSDNIGPCREIFTQAHVHPDDIKTLEDLPKLPCLSKHDLRNAYPFGLQAVDMSEVTRIHASSGTTGKPTVVTYTANDIQMWSTAMLRCLLMAGLHAGDIIQVSYGYGLFTGGLGVHYGAELLGAAVLPASVGNTDRQLMLMRDFKVSAICCTPSYFIHLIERSRELGFDLRNMDIRVGIFGAEPWSAEMRDRIESGAGIKAFDIYGLSEISGPGVSQSCPYHTGLHIMEDVFYPEVVDPKTGKVLPDGEEGELVLTTLAKEAMPLLRYNTRDLTRIIPGVCPCGRTLRRMERIRARTDDMLIIRGVNVFPSQIEEALLKVEGASEHYQIILRRVNDIDQLEIKVEIYGDDRLKTAALIKQNISDSIESILGIRAHIVLAASGSLPRSQGKAVRVIDERKI